MGVRGELFTTSVTLDNRTYFFNVKENRTGDVFLQVVESKSKEGTGFDRHAVVIFEEDMQKFLKGLDDSLSFIEKQRKQRKTRESLKKNIKDREESAPKNTTVHKTTGRKLHVVKKEESKGEY